MADHLRNAPLVEALVELKWALNKDSEVEPLRDLSYPTIIGLLYNEVKKEYPFIERLPQSLFPVELITTTPTHRFRSGENEWPLIQIGPGIATLNFTTTYNWESFRNASISFINALTSSYESAATIPPSLQQITLRYINAIPFQFTSQDVLEFLQNKLHIVVQFPTIMTESLGNSQTEHLNLQVDYHIVKPVGIGALSIGRGVKQGNSALVWDLAIASFNDDVPISSQFAQWLSDAHKVLENWFFTLVQGELLASFKGEE